MPPWLSSCFGDEVQRVSVQELSEGPGQFSVLSVSLLPRVGISGSRGSFSGLLALTQEKGGGVLFSTYRPWGWQEAGAIPVSCTPERTHSFFLKAYHKTVWRRSPFGVDRMLGPMSQLPQPCAQGRVCLSLRAGSRPQQPVRCLPDSTFAAVYQTLMFIMFLSKYVLEV